VINKLINFHNMNTLIRLKRFMPYINKLTLLKFLLKESRWTVCKSWVFRKSVLDFDTVIVTSWMKESFLPENLKFVHSVWCETELGLPHSKRKTQFIPIIFYHLLQRAKNIYLLYNTESEGLDAEKKSGLSQLEVENRQNIP
jgi:hypothetical protein